MYISAVFRFIAMNCTPYSPTVTWCAEFAAWANTSVGVCSSCGHCTLSKWSDCMGCDLKVVHHDYSSSIKSFMHIAPNGSLKCWTFRPCYSTTYVLFWPIFWFYKPANLYLMYNFWRQKVRLKIIIMNNTNSLRDVSDHWLKFIL